MFKVTAKQAELLRALKPFHAYSFNDMKQKLNSVSAAQNAIKTFEKNNFIKRSKVNNSYLYTIEPTSYHDYPTDDVTEFIKNEIEKRTAFFSIVVFGSRASGTNRKDSDYDIAIIINQPLHLNEVKWRYDVDLQIMTEQELFEMLTNKEPNLGKAIADNHKTVHNGQIFYGIIRRAMEHGYLAQSGKERTRALRAYSRDKR